MGIEIQILDWIQQIRTPAGDVFWALITKAGNLGVLWIVLAAVMLLIPRTRKSGILLTAALLMDLLLCNGILKNMFARVRPFDVNTSIELLINKPRDFSFPSGHTAASFASVTALFMAKEKLLWKAALLPALLISFSRLYLYVHYPTDVLGGILIGILSGYLGARICLNLPFGAKTDKR